MTARNVEVILCPRCYKEGPNDTAIRQCFTYTRMGEIFVTEVGYRCVFCEYEHGFQACPPEPKGA